MKATDVIVVGGGMIGAACAVGLGQLGIKTLLIERHALPPFNRFAPYDIRISAISTNSVNLLTQLNAWSWIKTQRVCPYHTLETWEMDGFSLSFESQTLNLPELGFMLENNLVQVGLWRTLQDYPCVQTCHLGIKQLYKTSTGWQLTLDNEETYNAPLIIAADGAHSQIRQTVGIGLTGWDYRQACMLILVDTVLPQQSITWQQFFPTGPRAFLPLLGNQACLVWYDSPKRIQQLSQLPQAQLTQQIMQAFPARLGEISVQQQAHFALTRRHAQHYFTEGLVLVGDAAHTINPLAGQGVNLGFKDVQVLLTQLGKMKSQGVTFDQASHFTPYLKAYQHQRRPDNLLMQTGMDVFYKGFKEPILPLKILRNSVLLGVNKLPFLKHHLLKYALGL